MPQTPANTSVIAKSRAIPKKRKLDKVPFVELYGGRLQGVVSSGSDEERVYVSLFEAGSTDFYCSTNNNRVCGGLRGRPCKHLDALLENAVEQYGSERVIRYLKLDTNDTDLDARSIGRLIRGTARKEGANEVFSRFLSYLRYTKLPSYTGAMPEMSWFITG